jgi:carbon storage regulator
MSNLVLSRKAGEEIVIGTDIRIRVLEIRGDKARIAIEAPRNVAVHRKEIAEAIAADNRKPSDPLLAPDHPDFGKDYA